MVFVAILWVKLSEMFAAVCCFVGKLMILGTFL